VKLNLTKLLKSHYFIIEGERVRQTTKRERGSEREKSTKSSLKKKEINQE